MADLVSVSTVGYSLESEDEAAVLLADEVDWNRAGSDAKSFHLELLVPVSAPLEVDARTPESSSPLDLPESRGAGVGAKGIVIFKGGADELPV